MEEKLFRFVAQTVSDITGKRGIVYDTDFVKDLGLNSFDIMNIVSVFEERFDTEIPNRDIWQMRQVKDVIEYMTQKDYTEV